jgi:hypothetical protein
MPFDVFQSTSDLRATWPALPDVDRAQAILEFQRQFHASTKRSISGRTLAASLHCSESLLRHLKPLTRATAAEKQQSREGRISTRKLRAIILERGAMHRRELDQVRSAKQTNDARKGAAEILSFFRKERVLPCYAEAIWAEARRFTRQWVAGGRLSGAQRPERLSSADIASRCWPAFAPDRDDSVAYLNRYGYWLAMWTCYALPHEAVREQAFELAWDNIVKGYSLPS